MRLLSGVLAGRAFTSRLDGDASLRQRPMQRVIDPLSRMGAHIAAGKEKGLPPGNPRRR
jgi:3-phosphoshikimate 1-carboxyvinyltransferase